MEPDICRIMSWHERIWQKQKNIEVKILPKCIRGQSVKFTAQQI